MTKVIVFIPTYRMGGIDVIQASLERQTHKPDLVYISDQLVGVRQNYWQEINVPILYSPKPNPIIFKNIRNLCAEYNRAARVAVQNNYDLFISLQDYIWLPPNGIERFVKIHELRPNDLITGITHISKGPESAEQKDALYSIFKEPYEEKPEEIEWYDVRKSDIYEYQHKLVSCYPQHWEANWAAVPVEKFKQGIFWDEEYDKGIAYENQDFAQRCAKETNCEIWLDMDNEAISLPHKKYFPGEEEQIIKYSNRWLYDSKWN